MRRVSLEGVGAYSEDGDEKTVAIAIGIEVEVKGLDVYDPTTGKVAVKVIDHYGDEVTKVFAV